MRIGIDLGGTKTEIIALDDKGNALLRRRIDSPHGDYGATVEAIAGLVRDAEAQTERTARVGVALPGAVSHVTGLIKNANSTWLNGRPLAGDLGAALGRPVRLANDANCFVLSESRDGAGQGKDVVFGVILGTGVGGGVAVQGRVLAGAHGIGGEWGHNPLPGMNAEELAAARDCYCGKRGCIETWLSGPGLAADFRHHTGQARSAKQIAESDDAQSRAAMARYADRLARALASVVNLLDPDAIVLGGGLSNIQSLYRDLPAQVESHAFKPEGAPNIAQNHHGDSSGVRGAAWLWDTAE